jgi:uncharacterized damage-inducible protein DinB
VVSLIEAMENEFHEEIPATRRVLERVPTEKLGWKPHPKSRSLGELAMHVAKLPGMADRIINYEEFAPGSVPASTASSAEEIREAFEQSVSAAEKAFRNLNDANAAGDWRLVFQGKEILRKPRIAALRTNMLNHMYHHRGQLSVYLRLLDVPLPMVYGPTADENPFLQKQ